MAERLGADKTEALRLSTLAEQLAARAAVQKVGAVTDREHYKDYPEPKENFDRYKDADWLAEQVRAKHYRGED